MGGEIIYSLNRQLTTETLAVKICKMNSTIMKVFMRDHFCDKNWVWPVLANQGTFKNYERFKGEASREVERVKKVGEGQWRRTEKRVKGEGEEGSKDLPCLSVSYC